MRRRTPSDSSRPKTSSIELAWAMASIWIAVPCQKSGRSVRGCWNLRFIHQASRGLIQRIAVAGTPRSRSQTQASRAVLPPPMIVKRSAGCSRRARSPGVTQRMPSAIANGGALVAGIVPSRYVVSTSLRRTRACHDAPVSRETKRCSPT